MLATPGFKLALVLMLVLALHPGWRPVAGCGTPTHIVMPATVAALVGSGLCIRFVRDRVRQTLQMPHLQTARMKGLSPARVFLGHALPFALPSLIGLFCLPAARLVASLIVVETMFGWPGPGSYIAEAAATLLREAGHDKTGGQREKDGEPLVLEGKAGSTAPSSSGHPR